MSLKVGVGAIGVSYIGCALLFLARSTLSGQELQPRAYLPAPVCVSFFGVAYSANAGGLLFDPSLPVMDVSVRADVETLSFGESLGLLGRSAQMLAVLPYVAADLSGKVGNSSGARHRSGLGDSTFRFAMNLHGARALNAQDFAAYRPKLIVGTSLTVCDT